MTPVRATLLALGSGSVALGVALAVRPGLLDAPGGALPLAAVVVLTATLAGGAALGRTLSERDPGPDADPGWTASRVPGDGFARQLDAVRMGGRGDDETREALLERLERAAVAALVARGTDPDAARAALADGTWTDDPAAAAFFAEGASPDPGSRERLRAALTGRPTFRRRAERAADAVAALADADGSTTAEGGDG